MTRFRLILSEALKSIGANVSTTFASAVSVLIGMFLIGAFIGLGTWLVSWSDDKKRELAVHVYFCSPASDERVLRGRPDQQAGQHRARVPGVGSARERGRHHVHHQGRGAQDPAQAGARADREPGHEPAAGVVRRHPGARGGHGGDRARGPRRRSWPGSTRSTSEPRRRAGSSRSRARSRSCR